MSNPKPNARKRIQQEIAALQRRMASIQVSGNGKRRGRRARRGGNTSGVPAGAVSNPNPVRTGRRGPRVGTKVGNGGRIVLSRDELLVQVKTTAGRDESVFSVDLKPSTGVMPFLFRLATCYQRIRWMRAHISWRPACGTNTNGIVSYGVAYNNTKAVNTRELVTSLTPCNDHPVWQSTGIAPLVVPADMLMSRKWYALNTGSDDPFDQQVGKFYVGISHDAVAQAASRGEFWISYTVEMEGTNPG